MTAGDDPYDVVLATGSAGLLRDFNRAGVLSAADVHVAAGLGRLGGEHDPTVLLAVALTVRAVRAGSVCIDVREVRRAEWGEDVDVALLDWPAEGAWYDALRRSPLVGGAHRGAGSDTTSSDTTSSDTTGSEPLRLVGDLLYLDRYWRQEQVIRDELARRSDVAPPVVDEARLAAALGLVFAGDAPDHQRLAAAAVATGWVTVVAGGPGTGKTTTVARLLSVLEAAVGEQRVALAAPTGRAAARLQGAVGRDASTVHRLLGWRPGSRSRFTHDRHHRLPFDVVVVDETSMVSLTLMSRLLEAVRPDARLVLVGDPDQLASVEAGAVLGDLVGRPSRTRGDEREAVLLRLLPEDAQPRAGVVPELRTDVVRLRTTHRYRGAIAELAEAVRAGDADRAVEVLRSGGGDVELVEAEVGENRPQRGLDGLVADVVAAGRDVRAAALVGDAEGALRHLVRHRLLCAHRRGPYGVVRWGTEVQRWLGQAVDGYASDGEWYRGRPLLVTANDAELGLYNGDAGVVVDDGSGGVLAAFAGVAGPVTWGTSRLSAVESVHAMTVHKSQGSQFRRVSVLLPPVESPLLTRELLYTAVTRAESHVRVVGTEAAVRAAVQRPISRASGLRTSSDA